MTNESSSRLRRRMSEFAVIVVGVLVALWIDAGWAWLQDRSDEEQLLADLAEEFSANQALLEASVHRMEEIAAAGTRLLAEGGSSVPADSLEEFLFSVVSVERFNPRLGTLESAIASGRIDLLRNSELRSALAGWRSLAEDASEAVDWSVPESLKVARLALLDRARGGDLRTALERLESDPNLAGMLAMKLVLLAEATPEHEFLLDETRRILELIAQP